jgi:hypothetical protein
VSEENYYYEEEINEESVENSKKKSFLPDLFDSFKKIPKKAQIGIIAAAAVVFVALIVVLIVVLFKSNNIENNSVLVYKTGNEFVVRINDKEFTLPDKDAVNFRTDVKEKRVYYTVPSSYGEDLYDLYYVELEKGEITLPAIIDFGVGKNFEAAAGKVYYLKYNKNTSAKDGCVAEIGSQKLTTFASNVDEIFIIGESGI